MMLGGKEQKLKATLGTSAEAHVRRSVYLQSGLLPKRKQLGFLVEDNIVALEQVEHLIGKYLYQKHNIQECVLAG